MKNLAIFFGGKSAEHDISIITAKQVMQNLSKSKYHIFPIYIDYNNKWYLLKENMTLNSYASGKINKTTIVNGFLNKYLIKKSLIGFKKIKKIDIAINCMHGLNGEDGTLAGLLELNNIPYVGSGVVASGVGMDKVLQKDVFMANNIPCVKYMCIYERGFIYDKDVTIQKIENNINYPLMVKPANLGSSIGINISNNREELLENIKIALNFDKKLIIEEQILNLREINCSCLGNYKGVETSVLEEPKNWKSFLDFNEKYLEQNKNGEKKQIDVSVGKELDLQIKNLSEKIFKLLGCCGVVRIDYLLNDQTKQIYVNEINTIPGSYAYYLWKHKYNFTKLLDILIELAEEEYIYKNKNIYAFKSDVLERYSFSNKMGTKGNKNG